MSTVRYRKKEFILFRTVTGWVAYNTRKPFKKGHTHLNNFHSAKDAIRFSIERRVPKNATEYYLISLQRLTDDIEYYNRLQDKLNELRGVN